MGGNVTLTDSRLYMSLDVSLHIVMLLLILSLPLLYTTVMLLIKWMRHRRLTQVSTVVKTDIRKPTNKFNKKNVKRKPRKQQRLRQRHKQWSNKWLEGFLKETRMHSRLTTLWWKQCRQAEETGDRQRLQQATAKWTKHSDKWWDNIQRLSELGIETQYKDVN